MKNIEFKNSILKKIKNYNGDDYPSHFLYDDAIGNDKLLMKKCIEELKSEGLITENQKFLTLTEEGERVAGIGYEIHINYEKEKMFEKEQIAEKTAKLQLKALQFNDTWKWTIILSAVVSVGALIVSILAYLKD